MFELILKFIKLFKLSLWLCFLSHCFNIATNVSLRKNYIYYSNIDKKRVRKEGFKYVFLKYELV